MILTFLPGYPRSIVYFAKYLALCHRRDCIIHGSVVLNKNTQITQNSVLRKWIAFAVVQTSDRHSRVERASEEINRVFILKYKESIFNILSLNYCVLRQRNTQIWGQFICWRFYWWWQVCFLFVCFAYNWFLFY